MTFQVKIRYECECGWRWVREVRSRIALIMDRPIATVCPGCIEEAEVD